MILLLLGQLTICAQMPDDLTKFELEDLGRRLNSRYLEAGPVISPDGNTLYFFITNHPENKFGSKGSQDIWYSEKDSLGKWQKPTHMASPLNEGRYNQVMTVSNDGSQLLVRASNPKKSQGFAITQKVGNTWSQPQKLSIQGFDKMDQGSFSGAYMSSNWGVLLMYFSEVKDSKYSDLYVSFKQADGTWNRPQKIEALSTRFDDFGPFLSYDDQTLYFASNRPKGRGGVDIYVTKRLDDTWLNWSKPVNAGAPLNTGGFDAYFSFDKSGSEIFTSRGISSADGRSADLFGLVPRKYTVTLSGFVLDSFEETPLYAEIRLNDLKIYSDPTEGNYRVEIQDQELFEMTASAPEYSQFKDELDFRYINSDTTIFKDIYLDPSLSITLEGTVYDKKEGIATAANVVLNGEKDFLNEFNVDDFGDYQLKLPAAGKYIFTVTKEGFFDLTDSILVRQKKRYQNVRKDLYLTPIEVGASVVLENIFFDFDKTTLRSESFPELDKVVDFLNRNPDITVEIGGHTDSKGSDQYNKNLSQGRAESVRSYLLDQNIDPFRISAKGYGEEVPIATNNTDEGRQTNRRVEFTILKD